MNPAIMRRVVVLPQPEAQVVQSFAVVDFKRDVRDRFRARVLFVRFVSVTLAI